jgi:hypothetical protein
MSFIGFVVVVDCWFDFEAGSDKFLGMSMVQEIQEVCAAKLGVNERAALLEWLREFDDDWDHRIVEDAAAGRLD